MEERIVFVGTEVEALALRERVRRAQHGDDAANREILDAVAFALESFYEVGMRAEALDHS